MQSLAVGGARKSRPKGRRQKRTILKVVTYNRAHGFWLNSKLDHVLGLSIGLPNEEEQRRAGRRAGRKPRGEQRKKKTG